MLGILIRKELLDNFYSLRFMVSSVICVFIIVMSVFVLKQDYQTKNQAYQSSITKGLELAAESDNYMELMFMGIRSARPPSKHQVLYTGVEKNPDTKTVVRSMLRPTFQGDLNFNPVFSLFPVVDLLFVVSIVMSLLAFVYSYDAVCGERERGTLKLLMSYSIPRDKIILSKWIGGYICLLIPYFIGLISAIIMISFSSGWDPIVGWVAFCLTLIVNLSLLFTIRKLSGWFIEVLRTLLRIGILFAFLRAILSGEAIPFKSEDWIVLGVSVLVTLLFIAVMYSLGLFVSVISKRSNTSISILLLIWVVFVLIIPNVSPFVVDTLKPIDSVSKVQAEVQAKTGDQIEDLVFKMLANFEKVLQRHLPGFAWSKFDFGGGGGGGQQQQQAQQQQGEEKQTQQAQAAAPAQQQQQKSGGGGGSPELSGQQQAQAQAAGVDLNAINALMGELTEQDLKDIKIFGCRSFLDATLKKQFNMSLDDVKAMAKDFGFKASDVDKALEECEIQKSRYLARLEKQGAAADDTSGTQDQAQAGTTAPVEEEKAAPTPSQGERRYSFSDLQKIFPELTDQDKRDITKDFWGGFVDTMQSNIREANDIWDERDNKVNSQMRLTKNISRISPVSAFIYAVTELADTGVEHDIYLREEFLGTYQDILTKFLETQLGMPYDQMPGKLDPMGLIKEPPKPKQALADFQKYDYTPMPLAKRIENAVWDIGVLFVFMVLFFMMAYVSFLRAQIID